MKPNDKKQLVLRLRKRIGRDSDSGQRTQADVAESTGVQQSHISKFLAGDFVRISPCLKKVCEELDIDWSMSSRTRSVRNNKMLMESLQRAWDGSDKHAVIISRFLDSIADSKSYVQGD